MKEFLKQNIAIVGSVLIIFLMFLFEVLFDQFLGQPDLKKVSQVELFFSFLAILAAIIQNVRWSNKKNYRLIFLNSVFIVVPLSISLVSLIPILEGGLLGGDGFMQGIYLMIFATFSLVLQILIWLALFIMIIRRKFFSKKKISLM